jgi:hypothetical protein
MSTVNKSTELTSFIYMEPDSFEDDGYTIRVLPEEFKYHSGLDAIELGKSTYTIDYTIPDRNELAQLAIKTLQEKQNRARADAERACNELQVKINALLQLEHIVDTPEDEYIA